MQSLLVVHFFDKMPNVLEGIFKRLVFIQIYLLYLQSFDKALGPVRIRAVARSLDIPLFWTS